MVDSTDQDPNDEPEQRGTRGAVLCLHGFSGSTHDMRPLAQSLTKLGFDVSVPALAGHDQTPQALAHHRWPDWKSGARMAFDALAERHEKVNIVGLSMGALIALSLGHERGARVGAIAALATPLTLPLLTQTTLSVVRNLPFKELLPFARKSGGPDISDPTVAASMRTYDRIPLPAAASLLDGQREARDRAPRISVPVFVGHGRYDHTAPVSNAHELFSLLRTPHRQLVVYPRSWHILTLDKDHEAVRRDVGLFFCAPNAPLQGRSDLSPTTP